LIPPFYDCPLGIGEAVEMSYDRINFGFVDGDGLPLGGEALLDEGFDAGFVCG